MDDYSSDDSLINGDGSAADYDYATGGVYSANQTSADAVDNGTINNAVTGTGTASSTGTVNPPAGGSSYTPPSWLSTITGLAGSAGTAATTLAPLINGAPAVSPTAAGVAGVPATVAGMSSTLILAIVGVLLFLFLGKKK